MIKKSSQFQPFVNIAKAAIVTEQDVVFLSEEGLIELVGKVQQNESPDYVLGVLWMIYEQKSEEILKNAQLRDLMRSTL